MRKPKAIQIWRCLSLASLLFLSAAYFWPTDVLYAITIWPPFVWTGLAFVLTLAGLRRHPSLAQMFLLAGWMAFWIGFGEERLWLPIRIFAPSASEAKSVVSLNCAGGLVEAAAEAFKGRPSVILLQESPSSKELDKLAKAELGPDASLMSGPDASIIVVGSLHPIPLPRGTNNFAAGIAKLNGIEPILVVSLRLQPPIFRLDYWSPECWRAYADNRANRVQELAVIIRFLKSQKLDYRWVIIGGDFNTPPDKVVFAELGEWLKPVTANSGYTATNEFPMARIDQIWSNLPGFYSIAEQTQNSDHRKVTWRFRSAD